MTRDDGINDPGGECLQQHKAGQVQPPAAREDEGECLATLLARAIALAQPVVPTVARQLATLRERLSAGHLQLAVLGQFKRGKSTLLNALLGASVLPTGVVPLTSIPTFISWGAKPRIRVTYNSAGLTEELDIENSDSVRDALFKFVAEEANPRNARDVKRVDLLYPSPLLQKGVILIDTPGIGSTHRHNTDAALNVLPECDAAIFVTSADPPITEAELAYLKTARGKTARMYFVLNKADYLDQRDLEKAVAFLRDVLCKATGEAEPSIYCVSALSGLKARQSGNAAALARSGVAQIEESLLGSLEREKLALLRSAIRERALERIAEAEADLRFKIRTLEMPVEDLEKRGAQLDEALSEIMESSNALHDLLEGDRRRIAQDLEDHAEQLRVQSRRYLTNVFSGAPQRSDRGDKEEVAARHDLGTAVSAFFDAAFEASLEKFGRMTEEALARRTRHVGDIVNDVRRKAADLFDVPFAPSSESEHLAVRHEPYWVARPEGETLISLPVDVVSRVLPKAMQEARLRRRLQKEIATLAQRNVENLRWALLNGIDEAFRRCGAIVRERMASALAATQGAVKAASALRVARAEGAAAEVARLHRALSGFCEIRSAIAGIIPQSEA